MHRKKRRLNELNNKIEQISTERQNNNDFKNLLPRLSPVKNNDEICINTETITNNINLNLNLNNTTKEDNIQKIRTNTNIKSTNIHCTNNCINKNNPQKCITCQQYDTRTPTILAIMSSKEKSNKMHTSMYTIKNKKNPNKIRKNSENTKFIVNNNDNHVIQEINKKEGRHNINLNKMYNSQHIHAPSKPPMKIQNPLTVPEFSDMNNSDNDIDMSISSDQDINRNNKTIISTDNAFNNDTNNLIGNLCEDKQFNW
jgi:hypothetical protein